MLQRVLHEIGLCMQILEITRILLESTIELFSGLIELTLRVMTSERLQVSGFPACTNELITELTFILVLRNGAICLSTALFAKQSERMKCESFS